MLNFASSHSPALPPPWSGVERGLRTEASLPLLKTAWLGVIWLGQTM